MSDRRTTAVDTAQPAHEPVGTTLARARQDAGLSLEDAARQLKFAPRQLDALERGEFGRLPGGAAIRGMVRSYARLLRLDADLLVARVTESARLSDAESLAQRFRQPVPFADGRRHSNVAYIAISVVMLAVVAAVAYQWRQERAGATRLTFVSAAQQPAEPARVTVASAAPALAPTPAPPATPKPAAAPSPKSAAAAAPTPVLVSAAAPQASLANAVRHRITLQFDAESWAEITSGSGKLLVSQLHEAGTERTVVGVAPFSVVIGNARQVRLFYDDKPFDLMPHVKVEVARFTLE
jgi:cytoskeleton protein RodZ